MKRKELLKKRPRLNRKLMLMLKHSALSMKLQPPQKQTKRNRSKLRVQMKTSSHLLKPQRKKPTVMPKPTLPKKKLLKKSLKKTKIKKMK